MGAAGTLEPWHGSVTGRLGVHLGLIHWRRSRLSNQPKMGPTLRLKPMAWCKMLLLSLSPTNFVADFFNLKTSSHDTMKPWSWRSLINSEFPCLCCSFTAKPRVGWFLVCVMWPCIACVKLRDFFVTSQVETNLRSVCWNVIFYVKSPMSCFTSNLPDHRTETLLIKRFVLDKLQGLTLKFSESHSRDTTFHTYNHNVITQVCCEVCQHLLTRELTT